MGDWRPDARDVLVCVGLALVAGGVALAYPPGVLVVIGLALLRLGRVI